MGPFGVQPLRGENDILQIRRALDLNLNIAVASLSSRYVTTVSQELLLHGEVETAADRSANRGGLTVVWPQAGEDIVLEEE